MKYAVEMGSEAMMYTYIKFHKEGSGINKLIWETDSMEIAYAYFRKVD
jgi:hypothetical protein